MDETSINVIVPNLIDFIDIDEILDLYKTSPLVRNTLNSNNVLYKLATKYDLPFIPNETTFDYVLKAYDTKYGTIRCLNHFTKRECLNIAATSGNIQTIKMLHSLNKEYITQSLKDYVLSYLPYYFSNKDNIRDNLNKEDYNNALLLAAQYGHDYAVELLIAYGADNYNEALIVAIKNQHLRIVRMMYMKDANIPHKNIDMIVKASAETLMIEAAGKEDLFVIRKLRLVGINNFNQALNAAAANGKIKSIKQLLIYGANNYKEAIKYAELNGHYKIVSFLNEYSLNPNPEMYNWYKRYHDAYISDIISHILQVSHAIY